MLKKRFGGVLVAGKKIQITLKEKIMKSLEDYADEKGLTKSAVITLAVEKYVREEENRANDKK
jgi:metal-responsive CopG/Arc/MetJ family transcriptional regulator